MIRLTHPFILLKQAAALSLVANLVKPIPNPLIIAIRGRYNKSPEELLCDIT